MNNNQREKGKTVLYASIGIALVFFLWWLYSFVLVKQGNSPYLFPDPALTFKRLGQDLGNSEFWIALGWTLLRLIVGFSIAFVAAAILGILSSVWKPLRIILKPFVLIMKTVPTAAVVFMVLLAFGTNWTPSFLVFLVVFPIIYESFLTGIGSIDSDIVDAVKLECSEKGPTAFFGIYLPIASPYISLSLVTSFGLAMKISIMSEIVAGGSSKMGIGRLIYIANVQNEMDEVMALSFVAIVIIALSDLALQLLKRSLSK